MSRQIRRPRSQRGIALLSIIALLLIFVIFAGAVVVQMAQEINSVHNDGVSNRALVAADAGVRATIIATEEAIAKGLPVPISPANVTYSYPEAVGASTVSYTATITQGWDPLPANGDRFYLISSTGTVLDGNQNHNRTVNVLVEAQSTSTFAMGTNYSTNQFGNPVWYTPDQTFDGPVYDGGPMHVEYDDTSTSAIFQSTVQTPGTPKWYDMNGGGTGTPTAWASIISGGQKAFETGVNPIGLPEPVDNLVVASEAFYGDPTHTSAFPSCGPVPIVCMDGGPADKGSGPLTTGIYVSGNATISGASSGSVETFTITAGSKVYTIKANFGTGNTTVQLGTGPITTYTGVPSGNNGAGTANGAIFVDGNATLMLGSVFQGQYVLTVPDYSAVKNNINIAGAGSITYHDPTKDLLGLWADNVILTTTASNVMIDAAIIAGYPGEGPADGGFYNFWCRATSCTKGNQGTLTLNGAVMENMRGALGEFFSLGVHDGFDRQINYDFRLASHPPPYFPVTGNYGIIAWDDEGN